MSSRHLILLRPCDAGGARRRLGFFQEDFKTYAHQKEVSSLYIDWGEGKRKVEAIATYVKRGSITDASVVDAWLRDHCLTEVTNLLLFELEVDEVKKEHSFRYIGTAADILGIIQEGNTRLKNTGRTRF